LERIVDYQDDLSSEDSQFSRKYEFPKFEKKSRNYSDFNMLQTPKMHPNIEKIKHKMSLPVLAVARGSSHFRINSIKESENSNIFNVNDGSESCGTKKTINTLKVFNSSNYVQRGKRKGMQMIRISPQ